MKKFFIAGTDTDAGKTLVSSALLHGFNKRGLSTAAVKPIAAGCKKTNQGLRNDDALVLQSVMSADLHYEEVNAIAFEAAIAPHIAADKVKLKVTAEKLEKNCEYIFQKKYDATLVEGAGGWRVPINDNETLSDVVKALNLPVVLVVGLKLGCINHSLLTFDAIKNDGLFVNGWVANQVDKDMTVVDENIEALKKRLACPFLGHIPFLTNPTAVNASGFLDIDKLLL